MSVTEVEIWDFRSQTSLGVIWLREAILLTSVRMTSRRDELQAREPFTNGIEVFGASYFVD